MARRHGAAATNWPARVWMLNHETGKWTSRPVTLRDRDRRHSFQRSMGWTTLNRHHDAHEDTTGVPRPMTGREIDGS